MAQENKTEKATPYRRRKLKEEGNVAKSHEVASSLVVLIGSLTLIFLGTYIVKEIVWAFLVLTGYAQGEISSLSEIFERIYSGILKVLLPLFFLSITVVVVAHIAQFGFIFTLKPLSFKAERLNPFEGLKKIFSLNTLFDLFKNSLKAVILIGIALFFLKGSIDFLLLSSASGLSESVEKFLNILFVLLILLGVSAFLIALLDFAYRRWQYEKRIMMSRQELKEEYKQLEGNPEVKGKLKARMRELARTRMMAEVPKASVVITNPTHIAIALKYDPNRDRAPVVVAKGKGRIAERIIEIAEEHGIPVIRKPELARAMYPAVEVGKEISPEFYKAVAEIIAYVMFKRKKVYA